MGEFKSRYVDNLPDVYRKDEASNNFKILNIAKVEMDGIKDDISDVFDILDIETATGKTLDLYGDSINQARGYATDSQYRVMIKSKIARNLMNGDLNSIIDSCCLMLGCKPSEVKITETDDCGIKIESLPYDIVNYVGLSASQVVKLISKLVPTGVTVTSIELVGTFEFSSSDTDYDEDKGFSDSETNPTIGGTLGYVFSDDDSQPLPF